MTPDEDCVPDDQWAIVRSESVVIQDEDCVPNDQWAVLRHEVEVVDMQQQNEPVRSAWDQRNTEDDDTSPQAPFAIPEQTPLNVDIVVAGVGGGGMNAVNRMISMGVRGVRFIAMNTDAQVLDLSSSPNCICLGQHYTKGLGAGGNAAIGMRAATESAAEIRAALGEDRKSVV